MPDLSGDGHSASARGYNLLPRVSWLLLDDGLGKIYSRSRTWHLVTAVADAAAAVFCYCWSLLLLLLLVSVAVVAAVLLLQQCVIIEYCCNHTALQLANGFSTPKIITRGRLGLSAMLTTQWPLLGATQELVFHRLWHPTWLGFSTPCGAVSTQGTTVDIPGSSEL